MTAGALGFDSARPWVAVLPEPSAPPPESRLQWLTRLSVQIRGLTVAQFPNAPLWLWLIPSIVASLTSGGISDVAEGISLVGLVWWAMEEIFRGVNWFRSLLGASVLIVTLVGFLA